MFTVERNLRGHHGAINSVCFSPNMKQLVSCSSDKSLILWGLQQRMKGYRYTFNSVSTVTFVNLFSTVTFVNLFFYQVHWSHC